MGTDLASFGRRIRILREDLDWTQGELRDEVERRAGVTMGASYLSQLERAKSSGKMPSLEVARGLALALGCSLDYLAGLTEDLQPVSVPTKDLHFFSEEADEVAGVVDSLPHPTRTGLVQMARLAQENERLRQERKREEFRTLLRLVEAVAGVETRRRVEAEIRRAGGDLPNLIKNTDHSVLQFS